MQVYKHKMSKERLYLGTWLSTPETISSWELKVHLKNFHTLQLSYPGNFCSPELSVKLDVLDRDTGLPDDIAEMM